MVEHWRLLFRVYRKKGTAAPYYDTFPLEVVPDEYILDAVERIWAFHDRSLTFRHACHHSTCGACGMRVNGIEKLTCITTIRSVAHNQSTVTIEPLRSFPVVSDLVVDMGAFYLRMERARYPSVASLPVRQPAGNMINGVDIQFGSDRLNDCIECGLCISACPIAASSEDYLGPAILAGIQFNRISEQPDLLQQADSEDGAWRCHSVYECTEVCPSWVDPAGRIMDLRRQILAYRIHKLFHPDRRSDHANG